jgi:hypothetical protein
MYACTFQPKPLTQWINPRSAPHRRITRSPSLPRDPINIPPILQQHPPDTHHPRLGVPVVRVAVSQVRVGGELRGAAPVGGRERLVPGAEDELRGVGRGVLRRMSIALNRKGKGGEGKETYRGDLMQLALNAEAESVEVWENVSGHPIQ